MLDLFGQADCASSHVTGPGWPGDAPLGHDQLAAERDYLGRRDCPHVTDRGSGRSHALHQVAGPRSVGRPYPVVIVGALPHTASDKAPKRLIAIEVHRSIMRPQWPRSQS